MTSFQIIGPAPRPDVAYRASLTRSRREQRAQRQLQRELEIRAADLCPNCGGPGYDGTYCTLCGHEAAAVNNGHRVDQRSARRVHSGRCGHCGGSWPDCCHYGWAAQGLI
jgi:hypothetical protein